MEVWIFSGLGFDRCNHMQRIVNFVSGQSVIHHAIQRFLVIAGFQSDKLEPLEIWFASPGGQQRVEGSADKSMC
ncbi:MAG TPA: hypothetical protein VFW05_01885 [Verrucomicrobiae bacterium]|nr:hypothetical protein [Verrucomicrobiae bacterium]